MSNSRAAIILETAVDDDRFLQAEDRTGVSGDRRVTQMELLRSRYKSPETRAGIGFAAVHRVFNCFRIIGRAGGTLRGYGRDQR